jgi:hypothetical protein
MESAGKWPPGKLIWKLEDSNNTDLSDISVRWEFSGSVRNGVFGTNPADSSGYITIQMIILHKNSKVV